MALSFGIRQPCDDRGLAPGERPCAARDRPWVLTVAVLGSSLAFIEGSIVNLALPSLQADLNLDSASLQWVVNAYLLTLSAFLLVGGASGDRFGLRRVYVLGLVTFGLASAACGAVSSIESLTAWRALQGIGAAFLVPTSLALINVYFGPEERAKAIGIWAGASALTTALGPLLGGVLVDVYGWRSVFLFIAPLAAAACVITLWRVPADAGDSERSLDVVGTLLLAVSLSLLTYGLVESGAGWALAGGSVLFLAFLGFEARSRSPMLPLGLFARRTFSGANAMTMVLYFALTGALYFIPFNLIQVQGYSAVQAGAAFLPLTLMLGFGSAYAGEQLKHYSPRAMLTAGSAIVALGFLLLTIPGATSTYVVHWLPGILVIGFGMTICVAPLTTVVMSSVDDSQSGVASGVNNTAARFAGLMAIAAMTALAIGLFERGLAESLAGLSLAGDLVEALLADAQALAGLVPPAGTADPTAIVQAIDESYVAVFRILMLVCAASAFLASALAWFTIEGGVPATVDP